MRDAADRLCEILDRELGRAIDESGISRKSAAKGLIHAAIALASRDNDAALIAGWLRAIADEIEQPGPAGCAGMA